MAEIFSVDRVAPPLNSSFFSFSLNHFFGEIFAVKVDPRNKELTTEKCFFLHKVFFLKLMPQVSSFHTHREDTLVFSEHRKK